MDSFRLYLRGNESNHWKRLLQKNLLHNIKGNMRGSRFQTVFCRITVCVPEPTRENSSGSREAAEFNSKWL